MTPVTSADLTRAATAIASKDAAALDALVKDGLLVPRADGSFYLHKDLFRIAAKAKKAGSPEEKKSAQTLLSQASKGAPDAPRSNRSFAPRSEEPTSVWLSDALAAAFLIQSYGAAAAHTLAGPLIEKLEREGVLRIVSSKGGHAIEFSDGARERAATLAATNPTALLLNAVIRSVMISPAPGHEHPRPSQAPSSPASDAAAPNYNIRTRSQPTPADDNAAPSNAAPTATSPSQVQAQDAPTPSNSTPAPSSPAPVSPPASTTPAATSVADKRTDSDRAHARHAAVAAILRFHTASDDPNLLAALDSDIAEQNPQVYADLFGPNPLMFIRGGVITLTPRGRSAIKEELAANPSPALTEFARHLSMAEAPKPAPQASPVAGPKPPTSIPLDVPTAVVKAVHDLVKAMADGSEAWVKVFTALRMQSPEIHALVFAGTTSASAGSFRPGPKALEIIKTASAHPKATVARDLLQRFESTATVPTEPTLAQRARTVLTSIAHGTVPNGADIAAQFKADLAREDDLAAVAPAGTVGRPLRTALQDVLVQTATEPTSEPSVRVNGLKTLLDLGADPWHELARTDATAPGGVSYVSLIRELQETSQHDAAVVLSQAALSKPVGPLRDLRSPTPTMLQAYLAQQGIGAGSPSQPQPANTSAPEQVQHAPASVTPPIATPDQRRDCISVLHALFLESRIVPPQAALDQVLPANQPDRAALREVIMGSSAHPALFSITRNGDIEDFTLTERGAQLLTDGLADDRHNRAAQELCSFFSVPVPQVSAPVPDPRSLQLRTTPIERVEQEFADDAGPRLEG